MIFFSNRLTRQVQAWRQGLRLYFELRRLHRRRLTPDFIRAERNLSTPDFDTVAGPSRFFLCVEQPREIPSCLRTGAAMDPGADFSCSVEIQRSVPPPLIQPPSKLIPCDNPEAAAGRRRAACRRSLDRGSCRTHPWRPESHRGWCIAARP